MMQVLLQLFIFYFTEIVPILLDIGLAINDAVMDVINAILEWLFGDDDRAMGILNLFRF